MKNGWIWFPVPVLVMASVALAGRTSSVTAEQAGGRVTSVPSSGMVTRTGQTGFTVKIINSCFGTNLRNVSNPLSPNSVITATIGLKIGMTPLTVALRYPGSVVTAAGTLDPNLVNLPAGNITVTSAGNAISGSMAGISGNLIQANVPVQSSATVTADGVTTSFSGRASVESYSFVQKVTACGSTVVNNTDAVLSNATSVSCGSYMGKDGPLNATVKGVNVSSDNSSVEISVSFPGQNAFCGGYFSPLMVFFDEERPKFDSTSEFPLNPSGRIAWPEAGAPGAFLAFDRDLDGKIALANELFGDTLGHVNGFEALRELDSNKDGAITARDSEFARLYLWRDKNGDGASEAAELESMKAAGIARIPLSYKKILRPIGLHAEENESAELEYRIGGKTRKAKIIDVWLAPIKK